MIQNDDAYKNHDKKGLQRKKERCLNRRIIQEKQEKGKWIMRKGRKVKRNDNSNLSE